MHSTQTTEKSVLVCFLLVRELTLKRNSMCSFRSFIMLCFRFAFDCRPGCFSAQQEEEMALISSSQPLSALNMCMFISITKLHTCDWCFAIQASINGKRTLWPFSRKRRPPKIGQLPARNDKLILFGYTALQREDMQYFFTEKRGGGG